MTPKPKGPSGGSHPKGGDGKKPSQVHGKVDAGKGVTSAHEAVAESAQAGRPGSGQEHTTTPSTTSTPPTKPNFENPGFDDRKLTEYALNPDHPVGGNKAKVIESATGLTKEDAAAVKQQILDQVKQGETIPGKVDEHGSRYAKDVTLTGPNGTIVVRTAWIVDANTGETRLATVSFPPKSKK